MSKSQVFFWLLVAFIAGVVAASFLPVGIAWVWVIFILGGITLICGVPTGRGRMIVGAFSLMAFAFGMFWFLRSSQVPGPSLTASAERMVRLEGLVDTEPVRGPRSQRFVLREESSGAKVLVITRPYPEFRYGDSLRVFGRLEPPENFSENFDYVAYLAKDDIFYRMAFPEIEPIGRGAGSPLYRFLFALKSAFAGKLNRLLPEPHSAFAGGLILGERRAIPAELTENLRITGTSHIVALSGYNITIVADALMKLFSFFLIPFSWAFGLAILGILGFTLLTGAAASVVRAAIMGVLVLIARREGRLYRMRNALAFAAAVMLFENPKILRFDIGFQLSFLATLGLLYGSPLVEQWYETLKLRLIPPARDLDLIREVRDRPPKRKRSFWRGTLISTLSAQLAVLPLIVYHFGTLSLVSPLANLAILPFIPATMFFGFLTGGLAFVSEWLGHLSAWVSSAFLSYELAAIAFFARLPLANLEVPRVSFAAVVGIYFLIGVWLWRSRRSHDKRQNGRP